jgi:parvulin-like peptidyl-prolyl isomerase
MKPQANITPRRQRPTVLLALGVLVGIVCAAAGLTTATVRAGGSLPKNAVAQVNGVLIAREDYRRVLDAVAQDKRDPVEEAQRRQLLDRLIEEELLVQRALELGVTRSDSKVRKDLTAAVIDSVLSEAGDAQPTDEALGAFYEQHRDFFAGPGRLRVRQIVCRVPAGANAPEAEERAQQAARRLRAGEDFAAVQSALGDSEPAPLPDAALPLTKLVDYLGPTVARAAVSLDTGQVSDPVRSGTELHVLQVVARQPDVVSPFAEIKAQVLAEYRRRAGEGALRAYLDNLRARANVEVTSELP